MDYKIEQLIETPPGGWVYSIKELHPSVGTCGPCNALPDLLKEIAKRYAANAMEVPADIKQRVANQMCPRLKPGWCEPQRPGFVSVLLRDLSTVVSGTRNLISWLASGAPQVDDELADARSGVCKDCPYNALPSGCFSCNSAELLNLIESASKAEPTKWHSYLNACHICGCALKVKIRIPAALLRANLSADKLALFPVWCWMRTEP